MKFKSLDALEALLSNVDLLKKTEKKNPDGIIHANSLIEAGKVKRTSFWEPPTADKENAYIEANGIKEYGKWFLGTDSTINANNKSYYTYAYTSDFEKVDSAGLIAVKQIAEQQRMRSIFAAASKML